MFGLEGLPALWALVLGVVWALYLGFGGADLGVSMLVRRVGGGTAEGRAAVLRAIGPTWQANDVWLVIAVAGTFGAFPGWYAAWASGLYGVLVVVLVALIVRHAGIELVGHAGERAARWWERAIVASAWATAVGWGIAWAAAVDGSLAAGGAEVLSLRTLLAGAALALVCRAAGAAYLAHRLPATAIDGIVPHTGTDPSIVLRRTAQAAVAAMVAAGVALVAGAAPEAALTPGALVLVVVIAAALVALVAAAVAGRPRVALWAAGVAAGLVPLALLAAVGPFAIAGEGGVDLRAEAAGDYTLTLMTVVAVLVLPAILAAQAFAYGGLARLARRALQELR